MSIFYSLYSSHHTQHTLSLPQRLRLKVHTYKQKTPLYAFKINRPETRQLQQIPTDPWPGSASLGKNICDGKFIFGFEATHIQELWFPAHLSDPATAELHSFDWLRHLRALSDNLARRVARHLIRHWIDNNTSWKLASWQPEILGCRVSNWISLYDFFCASADEEFREIFYKSLWRQIKHLRNTWQYVPKSPKKLLALYGLITASICLNFDVEKRQEYFEIFSEELQQQLLGDGGHIYRSPLLQLTILRVLIDLRALLRAVEIAIPQDLQAAIAKMAPLVRLFRHSDGGIACFGPYQKINSSLIDMVLSLADVRGRPPAQAPLMGYERCATKKGIFLVNIVPDQALTPLPTQGDRSTGIFNFEWSIAKQRILTTADLILQSASGDYVQAMPGQVLTTSQEQHDQGTLFTATFQQSKDRHNYHYSRSLYLSNNHFDFRGADELNSNVDHFFAIRFVLNPEIKISSSTHAKKIFLECPGGQRWQFLASNHSELHVENSEETGFTPVILVMGQLSANITKKVRWAFTALDQV